jgi:hypothetical protein
MLKKFITKPYVAVVSEDVVWPESQPIERYELLSKGHTGNSLFNTPKVFTSLKELLNYLNERLKDFVSSTEESDIGSSEEISLYLSASSEEYGDGDFLFSMPGVSTKKLSNLFELNDKQFIEYLACLDDDKRAKEGLKPRQDTFEYYKSFTFYSFTFDYYVSRIVRGEKIYHVTDVRFVQVNE